MLLVLDNQFYKVCTVCHVRKEQIRALTRLDFLKYTNFTSAVFPVAHIFPLCYIYF